MRIYRTDGKQTDVAGISNTTAMYADLRMMDYEIWHGVPAPVGDDIPCYTHAVCCRHKTRCYAPGEYDVAIMF